MDFPQSRVVESLKKGLFDDDDEDEGEDYVPRISVAIPKQSGIQPLSIL